MNKTKEKVNKVSLKRINGSSKTRVFYYSNAYE